MSDDEDDGVTNDCGTTDNEMGHQGTASYPIQPMLWPDGGRWQLWGANNTNGDGGTAISPR